MAVAIPKSDEEIQELIKFANDYQFSLIPRTAGTSLAGQVVGSGIIVDVSKHFTKILEVNEQESWARVQPGVIRNELNLELAKHGLYFAPETSTANRAMIGGMLGNNSCGANSIAFGSTREHLIAATGFLSDGSRAEFGPISQQELDAKIRSANHGSLESEIYQRLGELLSPVEIQNEIRDQFPKPTINRRNTGYAIDLLLDSEPLGGDQPINLAKLIAGSEGTLFFATEIKLNCLPLQPDNSCLICAHFDSVDQALQATHVAMRFGPIRCELIDHFVIEGARQNSEQSKALEFVAGKPAAILMIEFCFETDEQCKATANQLVAELKSAGLGYKFPVLDSQRAKLAWSIRNSGLGVINNLSGANRPVTVIEDAAVDLNDLPAFITEIDRLLDNKFDVSCVHYGHAGAGEIHLRPNLNLNQTDDVKKLREISNAVAAIVKKYRGSLSGEHGDGRLRSEHLQFMVGERCYRLFEQIKHIWDPKNIFNPGKITHAPPMDQNLRRTGFATDQAATVFRFGTGGNLLSAVEMCSGSGDCRKTHVAGGTMCPSYMATRNEYDSTRARANLLRQMLSNPTGYTTFEHAAELEQVKDIMDLCLSCKGCKNECPSNVDMAKIKAEFLQTYHDQHGVPFNVRALASFEKWCRRLKRAAGPVNFLSSNWLTSRTLKRILAIHPKRSLPTLAPTSLFDWFNNREPLSSHRSNGKVILFCDEFTNYLDVPVGQAAIELLELLGYEITIPEHLESGRTAISSGLLRSAKSTAEKNVAALADLVSEDCVMIGVEPSAILTIRDEYPDLVASSLEDAARHLSQHTSLIDEFLSGEIDAGRIDSDCFDTRPARILIHGHCHQKALSSVDHTHKILDLPVNFEASLIDSGCCGMAGFFGYETKHFELSMQIGELVLFPAIRDADSETLIAATGTSCRHQIRDGTGLVARHPVEILRDIVR